MTPTPTDQTSGPDTGSFVPLCPRCYDQMRPTYHASPPSTGPLPADSPIRFVCPHCGPPTSPSLE